MIFSFAIFAKLLIKAAFRNINKDRKNTEETS